MSQPHPELLVLAVALIALAMAPLASKLVRDMGDKISGELDGGRSGEELNDHLNESYDGALRDDEIAQMLEARAFLRAQRGEADGGAAVPVPADPGLVEEIRQMVVASNERRERMGEPLVDVDAEVARRLARHLGQN